MGSFRDLARPRNLMILLPVGLLVAGISVWNRRTEARLLAEAVPVEALVLESRVDTFTTSTGVDRERHWRPVVRYRYERRGAARESTRVTPLDSSGSRGWAEGLAARFQPGDSVQAWVDPADPERAYLVKIMAWKPLAGIIAGAGVALASAVGLVLQGRRRRAQAG